MTRQQQDHDRIERQVAKQDAIANAARREQEPDLDAVCTHCDQPYGDHVDAHDGTPLCHGGETSFAQLFTLAASYGRHQIEAASDADAIAQAQAGADKYRTTITVHRNAADDYAGLSGAESIGVVATVEPTGPSTMPCDCGGAHPWHR